MTAMEIIGWVGTAFLGGCAIPQVILAFRSPIAVSGLAYSWLLSWFIGISCLMAYVHRMAIDAYPWPVQISNMMSFTCASTLIVLKMKYEKEVRYAKRSEKS